MLNQYLIRTYLNMYDKNQLAEMLLLIYYLRYIELYASTPINFLNWRIITSTAHGRIGFPSSFVTISISFVSNVFSYSFLCLLKSNSIKNKSGFYFNKKLY